MFSPTNQVQVHLAVYKCSKFPNAETMTEVTSLCVCVLVPAGRACYRKTAAEIVSAESGASACSRRTLLPTGPLSLLHKYKHTDRY